MRLKSSIPLAAALLAAAFTTIEARADQCIEGPIHLPWLSGAPEWDDFDADGSWRPELHDPRWSGTPYRWLLYSPSSPAPGATSDYAVRVLEYGGFMYVSFQVLEDDTAPDGNDRVYFALTEGAGAGAHAVQLNLEDPGAGQQIPAPADPDGAGGVSVPADSPLPRRITGNPETKHWVTVDATLAAPVWTETVGIPAWLVGARWDRPTAQSPRWAVTVKVDLAAITASGDRKMFFGVNVDESAADTIMANVQPKDDTATDRVPGTIIPASSATWEQFTGSGAVCTTGVTLQYADVGVWTGAAGTSGGGGSIVSNICGGGACGTGDNTFRAIVRGLDTSAGVSAWDVRARFRIADWGSVPAYRDFGTWQDISTSPTGAAIFDAPTGSFTNDGSHGWWWQLSGSDATIDYRCDKGSDPYCPELLSGNATHQCMMVEIGQRASGTQVFQNTAVYRNMDYQDLSESKRTATVSIRGLNKFLTKPDNEPRDVYLHVSARNMPEHAEKALWLPSKAMAFSKALSEQPLRFAPPRLDEPPKPGAAVPGPAVPGPAVPGPAPGVVQPGAPQPGVAPPSPKAVVKPKPKRPLPLRMRKLHEARAKHAALDEGRVREIGLRGGSLTPTIPLHHALAMAPEALLDATWPTYRVRVFFDSRSTFTAQQVKDPVLVPMPSFGLRLNHEGSLYGFTHQLEADNGVKLEPVPNAPNWFKVTVPSEGSFKVKTTVVAHEEAKGGPGGEECKPGTTNPPCPTCPEVEHGRCHCRVVGVSRARGAELGGLALLAFAGLLRRRNRSKGRAA